MNPTIPSPVTSAVRPNIDRQKREQKTINTILGGAATTLVLLILFFGALAALGGYVLWKQIDKQSSTIAMLEANLRQEMVQMRDELEKADVQIRKDNQLLTTSINEQRAAIESLNQSQKAQNTKQDTQINQIDQRLKEVERLKFNRR